MILIGEAARRAGVSTKTLRYDDDIGLIEAAGRSPSATGSSTRRSQSGWGSFGPRKRVVCRSVRSSASSPLRARAEDIGRTIRELRQLRAELHRIVDGAEQLDPAECSPRQGCRLIG